MKSTGGRRCAGFGVRKSFVPCRCYWGFLVRSDVIYLLLRDLANGVVLCRNPGRKRRDKGRRFSSNRPFKAMGRNQLLDRANVHAEKVTGARKWTGSRYRLVLACLIVIRPWLLLVLPPWVATAVRRRGSGLRRLDSRGSIRRRMFLNRIAPPEIFLIRRGGKAWAGRSRV